MSGEETLFAKIIKGDIPCDKVYEDDEYFAFRDINPQAPTHILIIPKKPIPKISDATEADKELLGGLILTANRIADQEGLNESGYRFVINCGEGAGQTVFHVHLHLLGGRAMTWPPG